VGLTEELSILITAKNMAGVPVAEVQRQLDATRLSVTGLSAALNGMSATAGGIRLDTVAAGLNSVADAAARAGDATKLYGSNLDLLGGEVSRSMEAMSSQTSAFAAQAAAADLATAAITRQIAAIGDLYAVNMAGGAKMAAGTAAGSTARTAEQDLLNGRGAASVLTGRAGPLTALGAAAFSPVGIATIGGLYAGYKIAGAGAAFQSTEQQTISQIGGTPDTAAGRANIARGQQAAQAILAYGSSGKSPYSPTTLMSSIEPLLAHGFSGTAVAQALIPLAQLSGQNKAPNLTNAVQGANTYLALSGKAPSQVTGADITRAADYMSRMETATSIAPSQVTAALPKLLTGSLGTGLTPDQAGAAMLKVGMINPSARLDATQLSRLFQEMLVKNTVGAQKEASSLGLAMGPGSLQAYGGSFQAMVQAYANATAGPNQAAELAKLFPQTGTQGGLMAFKSLIAGGGTQQTMGYEQQLATSKGAAGQAYQQYSQGINQQATQLMNQLNTALTNLGIALDKTIVPEMLKAASHFVTGITNLLNLANPSSPTPATGSGPAAGHDVDLFMNKLGLGSNVPSNVWYNRLGNWSDNLPSPSQQWQTLTHAGGSGVNAVLGGGTAHAAGASAPSAETTAVVQQFLTNMRNPSPFSGPTYPSNPAVPVPATAPWYQLPAAVSTAPGGTVTSTGPKALGDLSQSAHTIFTQSSKLSAVLAQQADALNQTAAVRNAPAVAAQQYISAMITSGSTVTEVNKELATLKQVLGTSAYSPQKQAQVMATETKKVNTYETNLSMQAATTQVTAAQLFSNSVTLHHGDVQQQQQAAEQLYAASMALAQTSYTTGKYGKVGSSTAKLGLGDAQEKALGALGATQNTLANTTLSKLQEKVQLAQLTNNAPMLQQTVAAVVAYEQANAGALGLDSTQLQIDILQLKQQYSAVTSSPAVQLLRPNVAGTNTNAVQTNFGQTYAALASGPNTRADRTNQLLERENQSLRQTIQMLQAQLATQTRTERNTASTAASVAALAKADQAATSAKTMQLKSVPRHR
jgi:hypothetical protein